MFILTLLHDDTPDARPEMVPFIEDVALVGRGPGCTVALEDRNVSRVHARFAWRDDRLYIQDESRSGTFLRGVRLPRGVAVGANEGDPVRIGEYVLTVARWAGKRLEAPVRLVATDARTVPKEIEIGDPDAGALGLGVPRTESGCIIAQIEGDACSLIPFGPAGHVLVNGWPLVRPNVLGADDVLTLGTASYCLVAVATETPAALTSPNDAKRGDDGHSP